MDEGLRTVRQFNDLLRVLPPLPQQGALTQSAGRRNASPGRPLAPAVAGSCRPAAATRRPRAPQQPRGSSQAGTQAPNYQR